MSTPQPRKPATSPAHKVFKGIDDFGKNTAKFFDTMGKNTAKAVDDAGKTIQKVMSPPRPAKPATEAKSAASTPHRKSVAAVLPSIFTTAAADKPTAADTDEAHLAAATTMMRAQMAAHLFHAHSEEERAVELVHLEEMMASQAPTAWRRIAVARPSASAASQTGNGMKPSNGAGPAAAEFDEAAVRAATMIQARWKGRRARRRLLEAQAAVDTKQSAAKRPPPLTWRRTVLLVLASIVLGGSALVWAAGHGYLPEEMADAADELAEACGAYLPEPSQLPLLERLLELLTDSSTQARDALASLGGTLRALAWQAAWYMAVLCFGVYVGLRTPFWIAWLLSKIATHVALNGHPISFGSVRPWVSLGCSPSLTLHLDLQITDIALANPPHTRCRHPHLFELEYAHVMLHFDVSWLFKPRRFRPSVEKPLVVCLEVVDLGGLLVNIMLGRTGDLNTVELSRYMARNELRAQLGGMLIHPYRSLTLPNVLKIKILAARKLQDFPNLKPRCEVQVRKSVISTPTAERSTLPDGTTSYYFGAEVLLRATRPPRLPRCRRAPCTAHVTARCARVADGAAGARRHIARRRAHVQRQCQVRPEAAASRPVVHVGHVPHRVPRPLQALGAHGARRRFHQRHVPAHRCQAPRLGLARPRPFVPGRRLLRRARHGAALDAHAAHRPAA